MRYLLDTHILLWAAKGNLGGSFASNSGLPAVAREIIEDDDNELFFSAASIWEISIKSAKGQADFAVDPGQFCHGLLANGYQELPIRAMHTIWVRQLEHHHNDPFDRLLIAQAIEENLILMTSDSLVARYDTAPILLVT